MAGSYRHVTDAEGRFTGLDLIDNLGDAYETIEEMHAMIAYLASRIASQSSAVGGADPRRVIHEAWREGYLRPLVPANAADESIAGFDAFWADD